jgi:hypothetical protein
MADTARVDVSYRPLRIGWAVRDGDLPAIRQAVRYSNALWGGRFDPILVVDRDEEARQLVELFRLDVICPVGNSKEVKDFAERFPHLLWPFYGDSIFVKEPKSKNFSWALDVHNAIAHLSSQPGWTQFKDGGLRSYQWQPDDPLADAFLLQFGAFPAVDDIGVDYADLVNQSVGAVKFPLRHDVPIPCEVVEHPSVTVLGRLGIDRHYTVHPGWDAPGFYVGSIADPNDLVCFWNIRACDIPLWFVDVAHLNRYADLIPEWTRVLKADVEHRRHEWERRLGVWSRQEVDDATRRIFGKGLSLCHVSKLFWGGGAVRPPVMHFGQASTLGVMGNADGVPRVNFALADKPFSSDLYFAQQHLVASSSLIGGLYGDEQHTFDVPYVPELNEFYARTMHFEYDKLRIEPESTGLIIDAADHDTFLTAMPVATLLKRIFQLAGLGSSLSNSGRIVRQMLTQLGGVQGARVFKVPGARSLLKTFGLADTFTRDSALNVIRDKSTEHPNGTFAAHTNLFLRSRPINSKLAPTDVFSFMVDKGLFRMGSDLRCPKCDMTSWLSLDALKQYVTCDLCGHGFESTQQLIDFKWRFRRSGIFGTERNAQGAVPVALTLQQLDTTLRGVSRESMYSPSLDVKPTNGDRLPQCEIDLVWVVNGRYPKRTSLIFGECKDQGPIKPDEFRRDLNNLRNIADAFPANRFDTYILFAKMAPFTTDEIAMAGTLNERYRRRVILLTARELEPYHIFERLETELGKRSYAGSPEDLANVTAELYFTDRAGATSKNERPSAGSS